MKAKHCENIVKGQNSRKWSNIFSHLLAFSDLYWKNTPLIRVAAASDHGSTVFQVF